MIEVKNVKFKYDNSFLALDDINLNIEKNEIIAVIGENGAGKTTLMKLLNGLLKPTTGDVVIAGDNTRDKTTAKLAMTIGYVFQNPDDQIFHSNVYEEISYGLRKQKLDNKIIAEHVKKAIKLTKLEEYINHHPYSMPYSQRKFITLASIIAMDTDIVVLDEPTAGQDYSSIKLIGEIVKELHKEGKTIIVITHDMDFVYDYFEKTIIMADKKIRYIGDTKQAFKQDEILKLAKVDKPYIQRLISELGLSDTVSNESDLIEYLREVDNE